MAEEQVKYRSDRRDDAPLTQRTGDGGGWRNDPALSVPLRDALIELTERQRETREEISEVKGLAMATAARVARLDRERELDHEDVRRAKRDLAQLRALAIEPAREKLPSLHDLDAHIEDTARREARAVVRKARAGGWSARQIAALISAIAFGVAAIIAAASKVFGGGK